MLFYHAYEKAAEKVSEAAKRMEFLKRTDVILNSGGVIRKIGDRGPEELAMVGLAMLQPTLGDIRIVTGRYSDTDMAISVPAMRDAGIKIQDITWVTEMGGIELKLSPDPENRELSEEAKSLSCIPVEGYNWSVKFNAPIISSVSHKLLAYVFAKTLELAIRAGELEDLGIGKDENASDWADHLCKIEKESKTKASLSASEVEPEYKDLALEVFTRIKDRLITNLNIQLTTIAVPMDFRHEAIAEKDSIEVVERGISKYNTVKSIAKSSEHEYMLVVGDSANDIEMAKAAKDAGKFVIYVHVGISDDALNHDNGKFADVGLVFPDRDYRLECSPSYGSSATFTEFVFGLIEAIENGAESWNELYVPNAQTIIF